MSQMPVETKTISGTSLARVTSSTTRAPDVTPLTLIATRPPNRNASSIALPGPVASVFQTTPSELANALATDATANEAISQYSTPPRNPTYGPNAASM